MPPFRAREPFAQLLEFVREERVQAAQELAVGRWETEAAARELVGRVKALDAVESKMRDITGPNSHFGERDA